MAFDFTATHEQAPFSVVPAGVIVQMPSRRNKTSVGAALNAGHDDGRGPNGPYTVGSDDEWWIYLDVDFAGPPAAAAGGAPYLIEILGAFLQVVGTFEGALNNNGRARINATSLLPGPLDGSQFTVSLTVEGENFQNTIRVVRDPTAVDPDSFLATTIGDTLPGVVDSLAAVVAANPALAPVANELSTLADVVAGLAEVAEDTRRGQRLANGLRILQPDEWLPTVPFDVIVQVLDDGEPQPMTEADLSLRRVSRNPDGTCTEHFVGPFEMTISADGLCASAAVSMPDIGPWHTSVDVTIEGDLTLSGQETITSRRPIIAAQLTGVADEDGRDVIVDPARF